MQATPNSKTERLAITGANGFIGLRLTSFLEQQGYPILTITRRPFESGATHNYALGPTGLKTIKSESLNNINTVIHLAAQAHNPRATTADYYENNLEQTKTLLEAAQHAGVKRFLYVSSVKAVGESSGETPFSFNTEPKPEDDYGRSKLATEEFIQSFCKENTLDYIILRLPLILDPGAKGNIGLISKALKAGIPLPLNIQSNKRDCLSIANFNSAVLSCLTQWPEEPKTFFLSDGKALSTSEIIQASASFNGCNAQLFKLPHPLLKLLLTLTGKRGWYERLTGNLEVDIQASRQMLNWKPVKPTGHTKRAQ